MKLEEKIIGKMVEYFSKKPEITAVYLYGSYARGEANEMSDIDLGVVLKERQLEAFSIPEVQMAEELSDITGIKVEIQNLELCRIDFAHRVVSEGLLIYSGDEKLRVEFEEKIFRDYFDIKPMLEEYYYYLSQMAKKGELGARYTQD